MDKDTSDKLRIFYNKYCENVFDEDDEESFDEQYGVDSFISHTQSEVDLIKMYEDYSWDEPAAVNKELERLHKCLDGLSNTAIFHIKGMNSAMRKYEVDPVTYLSLCASKYTRPRADKRLRLIIAERARHSLMTFDIRVQSGGVFVEYLDILKPLLGMKYDSKKVIRNYFNAT